MKDRKLQTLQHLLSIKGGDVSTLERVWLITQVNEFDTVPNMWMQFFMANGHDTAFGFLSELGYTGSLEAMWNRYWYYGGGTIKLTWWIRFIRIFGIISKQSGLRGFRPWMEHK